jgi:hypothetical protein
MQNINKKLQIMKRLLTLLFIIGIVQNSSAIIIQQLTVTSINTTAINIHSKVADGYYFEYYSHNYEIINNTITLNICYSPYLTPVVTNKENDFVIPNINITPNNFTLVVNIYKQMYDGSAWICDSPIDTDTAALTFSTPLNNAVTLSSNEFNEVNDNLMLFPSPTTGIVNLSTKNEINVIKVYDKLGRKVKMFSLLPNNVINLSNLEDGIYLIKLSTDKGDATRKIILKK